MGNFCCFFPWKKKCYRSSIKVSNIEVREFKDEFKDFHKDLFKDYFTYEKIGEGAFGIINKIRNIETQKLYALKTFKTKNLDIVYNEIRYMNNVIHPNLIFLHDIFFYNNEYHLILDYLPNGNLFEYLNKNTFDIKNLKNLKKLSYNILKPLIALSEYNLYHLDVKLENFMIKNKNTLELVLIDFGSTNKASKSKRLYKINKSIGTKPYSAPEVNMLCYSTTSDIWSFGVLLYVLSARKLIDEIYSLNQEEIFYLIDSNIKDSSLKSLIKNCLVIDYKKRITFKTILDHEFFYYLDRY